MTVLDGGAEGGDGEDGGGKKQEKVHPTLGPPARLWKPTRANLIHTRNAISG